MSNVCGSIEPKMSIGEPLAPRNFLGVDRSAPTGAPALIRAW